jgi:hypothetical protein
VIPIFPVAVLGQFGHNSNALRNFEMRQVIPCEPPQSTFGRGPGIFNRGFTGTARVFFLSVLSRKCVVRLLSRLSMHRDHEPLRLTEARSGARVCDPHQDRFMERFPAAGEAHSVQ